MPATQPPWVDTGVDLAAGDTFTLLADGRVYLSKLLDIWVPPWFQIWCRVGDAGPIFRGTRNLQSFTATSAGRLWLANYFPGEWSDRTGKLATPESDYAKVSGGTSILVLKWAPGADVPAMLRSADASMNASTLPTTELARQAEPVVTPPEHWEYLWYLGPAEIYRPSVTSDGRATIGCLTHGDSGILHRDARMPLRPGTKPALVMARGPAADRPSRGHAALARVPEHRGRVRRRPGHHVFLERVIAGRHGSSAARCRTGRTGRRTSS